MSGRWPRQALARLLRAFEAADIESHCAHAIEDQDLADAIEALIAGEGLSLS